LLVVVMATCLRIHAYYYTDHYAVEIDGGVDEARSIADQHGFTLVNEVRLQSTPFLSSQ